MVPVSARDFESSGIRNFSCLLGSLGKEASVLLAFRDRQPLLNILPSDPRGTLLYVSWGYPLLCSATWGKGMASSSLSHTSPDETHDSGQAGAMNS